MDILTCISIFLMLWLPSLSSDRGINLRYFISKNEIMVLKCEIPDDSCCSDINKIEFFKNGEGVCTFKDCRPFFDVPLHREDTRFYRCGCSVGNTRKTHLITTELRETDYGKWSCACSCDAVTCRSETISILPPASHEENDIGPRFIHENWRSKLLYGWIASIVIALVTIIGVFFCMLCMVRCCISRRVKTEGRECQERDEQDTESTRLTSSNNPAETLSISENTQETESYPTSNKPRWCICSKCEERKRHSERLCCGYVECVTLDHDFENYCFKDIDVMPSSDSEKQREKRNRAYENYNNWIHKIDDKQELIAVPACCVGKIRNKFPDPKGHYLSINKRIYFRGSTEV